MNQYAEYVSPGHPDRIADAIAEGIVNDAIAQRPDSLVGVEVAVHRDSVFIDGRIATGNERLDLERIVRDVYIRAGYGGPWIPSPDQVRITADLCEEELPSEESDIRPFSDDQNIVIGYACGDRRSNYLPTAHWVAGEIGRGLDFKRRHDDFLSANLGPDFKVLVSLDVRPEIVRWNKLILSIQHLPGMSFEDQHRIVLPILGEILGGLEKSGLEGTLSTFDPGNLLLNGAGEFATGGPEGDNGLSGKKLVVDHYGPSVPIGGGAISGKDPHKVDKCGAVRARQLAKQLVKGGVDEATVTLGWAPGGDVPFVIEATSTRGGVRLQVPREELPPDEWFSIERIVGELELTNCDWQRKVLSGYFSWPHAPWEWR